ncbi:hypothetical protein GW7_09097 [Heterocephalus glaber]|uniref:Uncharacterized protein n=1 Tax=Heterocephalus glaber TaxID=10181 RepID=G5C507_HETGA|nr:hypothetical protein GW7_09097 [Heterocephalus glaber]
MEPRPVTSHKENVSPRPVAPLRPGKSPKQRRFLRTLGVSLGSGHGPWVPLCRAARGEPADTCSPRATLCQEPSQVQTNLTSPRSHPALKDTLGRLVNSSFPQQSNLQPCAQKALGQEPAAQQSNLCLSLATSPPPQGSLGALAPCLWPAPPATEPRPTAGFAPPHGCTWPGPRFWGGLGSWTSRLTGEPLTLEDLAVPAQRQAWDPSHAPTHQLLASMRHLEKQAACPRGRNKAQDSVAPEETPAARQQLLSRCFRAWKHVLCRQWVAVVAMALSHSQLLQEGFRERQWTLWLQEAQLEVAWRRHWKALLAQSFREVSPVGGDGAGVAGSQKEEEGAWPPPSQPRQRLHSGDDEDGRVQTLQVLQQLAGDLALWSSAHDVETVAWVSLHGACWRLALRRALLLWGTQLSQGQRANRWQLGGARDTEALSEQRAAGAQGCWEHGLGSPRWLELSEPSQLSSPERDLALWSSAHDVETVAWVSLHGACWRLALRRALLLWGTQLSQGQRAK